MALGPFAQAHLQERVCKEEWPVSRCFPDIEIQVSCSPGGVQQRVDACIADVCDSGQGVQYEQLDLCERSDQLTFCLRCTPATASGYPWDDSLSSLINGKNPAQLDSRRIKPLPSALDPVLGAPLPSAGGAR